MLVIRLRRTGRKKTPRFRVIVAERDMPIYGRFVEIIGHADFQSNPKVVKIDKEKALDWMKKGAKPSDTVARLMVREGILDKEDLNWKPDKKRKKRAEAKKEASESTDKPKEDKKLVGESDTEEKEEKAENKPVEAKEEQKKEEVKKDEPTGGKEDKPVEVLKEDKPAVEGKKAEDKPAKEEKKEEVLDSGEDSKEAK